MNESTRFGKLVRAQRKRAGRTGMELVEQMRKHGYQLSQGYLSRIETDADKQLPGGDIIVGLARTLNVTPNDLLGFASNNPEGDRVGKIINTLDAANRRSTLAILQDIQQLDAQQRERNLRMLRSLLDAAQRLSPEQQAAVLRILTEAGLTDVADLFDDPVTDESPVPAQVVPS